MSDLNFIHFIISIRNLYVCKMYNILNMIIVDFYREMVDIEIPTPWQHPIFHSGTKNPIKPCHGSKIIAA